MTGIDPPEKAETSVNPTSILPNFPEGDFPEDHREYGIHLLLIIPIGLTDKIVFSIGNDNQNWMSLGIDREGRAVARISEDATSSFECRSAIFFAGLVDVAALGPLHFGMQWRLDSQNLLEVFLDGQIVAKTTISSRITMPDRLKFKLGSYSIFDASNSRITAKRVIIYTTRLNSAELSQMSRALHDNLPNAGWEF